jgi:WD40 repeat protein
LLAAGGWKGITMWDLKKAKPKPGLNFDVRQVLSLAFSPDGSILASGDNDQRYLTSGRIYLWDVETGQEKATLWKHTGVVSSLAFSPDGRLLASGSHDKTVRLWDVKTGQEKATFRGYDDIIQSVAFSPDGTLLAVGGQNDPVRIWDVKTGKIALTLKQYNRKAGHVAFSPGGTLLAIGHDNVLKVWDLKAESEPTALEAHKGAICGLAFRADGEILASCSSGLALKNFRRSICEDTVKLWSVKANRPKGK